MAVEHRIVTGQDFARVARALKEQDKTLPRKFRTSLRKSANESIAKVKKSAMQIDAKSGEHTGVRKRLARGVKLQMSRSNLRFRIITTMRDPDEAMLPRGFDSALVGWRHPVFADTTEPRSEWEWTQQYGDSWFIEPIGEEKDNIRAALIEVLDDAAREIDRAS